MHPLRTAAFTLLSVMLSLPVTAPSAARPPAAPEIDEIHIDKSDHRLELRREGKAVKTYRVAIGPGGAGPKRMEGDQVTPVGTYTVTGRINGLFHQFLVVSYPNDDDRRRFAELKKRGEIPSDKRIGNGIGIHGTGQFTGEANMLSGRPSLVRGRIREAGALLDDPRVARLREGLGEAQALGTHHEGGARPGPGAVGLSCVARF